MDASDKIASGDYSVRINLKGLDELERLTESFNHMAQELGYVDLDDPAAINIYASSFENKDVIEDAIATYNEDVDELAQIKYTDYVGITMSSITTIINAITYVLIAFVAISLIVRNEKHHSNPVDRMVFLRFTLNLIFLHPHQLKLMYSRHKFMSLLIWKYYFCHRIRRNNKLECNLITFVFPFALNSSDRRIIHCLCMR